MSRLSTLLPSASEVGSIPVAAELLDRRDTVLLTHDKGLQAHWTRALGKPNLTVTAQIVDFSHWMPVRPSILWVDMSIPGFSTWQAEPWPVALKNESVRIVAASSNPNDAQAMAALDAGCAAYVHAYSDAGTLKQVRDVVHAGQVWIGRSLMQRLLHGVSQLANAHAVQHHDWSEGLTPREVEVAKLAAGGASNQAIASQCHISERTVKAHLSAAFSTLNIADRLQLALRVHGIH